jgi:hypothetical protein
VGKRATKSRPIITPEDVPLVFDDARIRELASHLPPESDLNALGWWVTEAADLFTQEVRIPNVNQVHTEIAMLHEAAGRQLFERVAELLDTLSADARAILPELPSSNNFRDDPLHGQACDSIAMLCRIGDQVVEGRRRPGGKRSPPSIQPILLAPLPQQHPARREAERRFVIRLSVAWRCATGKPPPRTARHADAGRTLGPFARFVRDCLRLVGAKNASVVDLINEVGRETPSQP